MTPLRAGVIGVGHLGQHHARLYASLPEAQLIGVMDQLVERAQTVAERHGVRIFRTAEELLPHVDVVSVAVPTSGHYAVAKACLQAGKHVLIEKPIAATPAEAQELVQLAKQRGCCVQVGHSERFNPVMALMRPYIGQPVFIECHRLSSFSEQDGRGYRVDLMIHDLDLIVSMNPGPVRRRAAKWQCVLLDR
jgi:predicted dehydrogenase